MIPREIPKTPCEVAVVRTKTAITLQMLHDLAKREVSNNLISLIMTPGDRAKILREKIKKKVPQNLRDAPIVKLKPFLFEHPEKVLGAIEEFEKEILKGKASPNTLLPFYEDLKQLRRGILHAEKLREKRDRIIG